jgi:hypothetical protein
LNLHYLKHFVWHYLRAGFVDILHSPFVFELYQTCIKREKDLGNYKEIEMLRMQLKKDERPLFYEDFGASQQSRETKVSILARQHLKPARIAQILSRMMHQLFGIGNKR